MRFPRLRFTVRRLMVAVAVVALMTATAKLLIQKREYDRKVAHHELRERFEAAGVWSEKKALDEGYDDQETRDNLRLFEAYRAWDEAMKIKYRYASRRPWLPVPPDAPEPK